MKKTNGKVLMAAIAGTVAGIIAGLLMAPQAGADIRNELTQSALQAKRKMNEALKKFASQQQSQEEVY